MEFSHVPVLLEECLEGLAIRPDGIYLDGTAGGAGHSREIARRPTTGRLLSLEQDPDAVEVLERLEAAGIPVMELARGDEMRYNTTSVSVLWPVREHIRSGQDANELPLVLSIRFGPYTILSASDLSGAYERYAAAPADVLKVAHHGSADSSGEAFLDQVGARVALVSCSSGSRYLPGEATLERLTRSGAQVLRTDDCGDITLTRHGDQLYIPPYKVR